MYFMPPVTKPCATCGVIFTRQPTSTNPPKYCSRTCFHTATRKPDNGRKFRRYERSPNHPLASVKGTIPTSRRMLYDHLGEGEHPCHWCGFSLKWRLNQKGGSTKNRDLLVDHLDGDQLNDDPDNLVATCQSCNTVRALAQGWMTRTGRPISDLERTP